MSKVPITASLHQSSAAPATLRQSNKLPDEALQLVDPLGSLTSPPTRDVIYRLLQECIKRKDVSTGRHLYFYMVTLGLDSITVLVDHLIRLFAECGCLFESNDVFSKMSRMSTFTWNAIISAHANFGEHSKALNLYQQMQLKGAQPDRVTFLMVLKASRSIGDVSQVQLLHNHINLLELDLDVVVGSTLIDVYAKCGAVEEARRVFDRLRNRNIVSWGAMLAGYVQHGHCLTVLLLYKKMASEGIEPNRAIFLCLLKSCSNIASLREGRLIHDQIIQKLFQVDIELGNSLIDMYAKCGSFGEGRRVFVKLGARTVISWGTMIAMYTRQGRYNEALLCFMAMQQEGLNPDHVIFTSILTACSQQGLLVEGQNHFLSMIDDHAIAPNMEHYSCMIDLLGRVGCINEAVTFLHNMPLLSDSVLLTSLLTSSKTYHNVELGRFLFDILVEMDPTDASLYVLMSNIYADAHMWDGVYHLQARMRAVGAWKKAGLAWIEVGDEVHEFTVGIKGSSPDYSHPRLHFFTRFLIHRGYVPQLDLVW